MRGYFGIGIYHCKTSENIGTLWRAAYLYGASYIFTIGKRFPKKASDTVNSRKQIPLFEYQSYEDFYGNIPNSCQVVCIEQSGTPLKRIVHPEQTVYLLGSEDQGLPSEISKGKLCIEIETQKPYSMNVAMAGSIVMYDRFIKLSKT